MKLCTGMLGTSPWGHWGHHEAVHWDVGDITMGTVRGHWGHHGAVPWEGGDIGDTVRGHWEHRRRDTGDNMKLCIGMLGTSPWGHWGHHEAVYWDVGDVTMGTLGTSSSCALGCWGCHHGDTEGILGTPWSCAMGRWEHWGHCEGTL